jgi:hypothetical protein
LKTIIPETVYKYRDLNEDIHKRIITHQEIYFAKPSEFPASYECKYKIDRDFIKNESNRRIYYAKILGTQNLFHPQINKWIDENQITEKLIDMEESEAQKVIDNIYGIFSVSLDYRNEHLWQVFGGNNKGFCVGLDFQGVLPLNQGTKGRVKYMEIEHLPKTKVLNYDDDLETLNYVFDLILSLPIDYIDEQEYRMQRSFSKDSDRYIKIAKRHIKSIILGYKMPTQKRNELVELIKKHLPEAKINRLKYSNGKIIELNLN